MSQPLYTPLSQKRAQFSVSGRSTKQTPSQLTPRPSTSLTTSKASTGQAADSNAITVGVRVRPLSAQERAAGYHECARVDPDASNNQVWFTDKAGKSLKFHCDYVFTDQTSPSLPVAGRDGIVDPNCVGEQRFIT